MTRFIHNIYGTFEYNCCFQFQRNERFRARLDQPRRLRLGILFAFKLFFYSVRTAEDTKPK